MYQVSTTRISNVSFFADRNDCGSQPPRKRGSQGRLTKRATDAIAADKCSGACVASRESRGGTLENLQLITTYSNGNYPASDWRNCLTIGCRHI